MHSIKSLYLQSFCAYSFHMTIIRITQLSLTISFISIFIILPLLPSFSLSSTSGTLSPLHLKCPFTLLSPPPLFYTRPPLPVQLGSYTVTRKNGPTQATQSDQATNHQIISEKINDKCLIFKNKKICKIFKSNEQYSLTLGKKIFAKDKTYHF